LKGDINHLRRILAEDIEWIHPALGEAHCGVESVIDDVLISFWGIWEVSRDSPRSILGDDAVVVLGTYRAPSTNQQASQSQSLLPKHGLWRMGNSSACISTWIQLQLSREVEA
jgi:hypothetical protein